LIITNPVDNLNISKLTSDDFKDCRITPDGKFSIYDCISKFKGCSQKDAFNTYNRLEIEIDKIFMYQFNKKDGRLGQPTPVCTFSNLLIILSQLPGVQAKILRSEQADIATRAIAGDEDLKEFIQERGEHISVQEKKILMNGLVSRPVLQENISTDITPYQEKLVVYFGTFEPTAEFIEENKEKIDFNDGKLFGKYGKTKQLQIRNQSHIKDNKFINYKFMNAIIYNNNLDMKNAENRVSRILSDLKLKIAYYNKDEIFRYNKEDLDNIYESMIEHQFQEQPIKIDLNLELEKYKLDNEMEIEKYRIDKEMIIELFKNKDIYICSNVRIN